MHTRENWFFFLPGGIELKQGPQRGASSLGCADEGNAVHFNVSCASTYLKMAVVCMLQRSRKSIPYTSVSLEELRLARLLGLRHYATRRNGMRQQATSVRSSSSSSSRFRRSTNSGFIPPTVWQYVSRHWSSPRSRTVSLHGLVSAQHQTVQNWTHF